MKKPFNEPKTITPTTKEKAIRTGLGIACSGSFLFLMGVYLTQGNLTAGALTFLVIPALAGFITYTIRK